MNHPLPELSLECFHGLTGPDTGWNHVVVLEPPVGKAALDEGILGVEGFTIPDAATCCLSCLVWEVGGHLVVHGLG